MNNFSQLHRFSDLAEIQQLVGTFGWKLSYTRLAPGRVEVEAYETRIGDCLLFRERFGCPTMANGTSTPEAFDVLLVQRGTGRMFGHELSRREIVLIPPGCEVDAVGLPGVETLHVQVPDPRLVAAAAKWNIELLRSTRAAVVEPGIDRMRRFRHTLAQAIEILDRGDLDAWDEIEKELLVTLVAVFDRSMNRGLESSVVSGPPVEYAIAARDYVQSTGPTALDIDAVAKQLGIGRAHLNRCFKRHYGVTIRQFIHFRRLQIARELLSKPSSDINVTEAAFRCGFNHLGRFAADYKRLFDETPRQTLNHLEARN